MTKRVLSVLSLLCVLTLAMAGNTAAPTVAAPTTPPLDSTTAPEVCAPPADEWGGCRWYCGSKSYLTQAQCQANCSTTCEDIC